MRAGVIEVWQGEDNGWLDRLGRWIIAPGHAPLAPL
jgi:hypothetical protein